MSPVKNFRRQHQGDKIKLKDKWRRPRGLQSKLRLRKRGHGNAISIGYKAPRKQRGRVAGLNPVLVATLKGLKSIDAKQQAVVIAAAVGFKKRDQLIAECAKLGIKVLNYANPSKYVADMKAKLEAKRAEKEKKPKKKSIEEKLKKEEVREEKQESEVKEKKEDIESKEKQKLEKDKVLTKRQ